MDANGLRFWSFLRPSDWRLDGLAAPAGTAAANLKWIGPSGLVELAPRQPAPTPVEDETLARALAAAPSVAVDAAGTWAFWDPATVAVRTAGAGAGSVPLPVLLDRPPGTAAPDDIALGIDDVLYLARNGGIVLVDRRDRWPPARATLTAFHADRLAVAPAGGMWVLDRTAGRLARLSGLPLRSGPYLPKNDDVFVPVEPNPDPPTLRLQAGVTLPAGHAAVDVACSPGGRVMLLTWRPGAAAVLFLYEDGVLRRQCALTGLMFPISLAWLDESSVAVIATDSPTLSRQVFIYDLTVAADDALPSGAIHPLVAPWRGGFAKAPGLPPRYPIASLTTRAPAMAPPEPVGLRPLQALSRASYARSGHVTLGPLDAGASGNIWHRLFLEASIPPRCGVRVWARADDAGGVPALPGTPGAPDWHPHVFGAAATVDGVPDAAQGIWVAAPSELPCHPGVLPCPPLPDRSGLFVALMQRPGRRVRQLAGRYLWLHVELVGDSLETPQIAALRVHGARFAYRDRYLPPMYRETVFGPDGDAAGTATRPDFLDRFLGLFEGAFTDIENRVADSWLLTDPASVPDPSLGWLGSWIGLTLDSASSPARQRQIITAAPYTAALHGTLGGLMAALELATGGVLVRGGQVDLAGRVPRPGQLALAQLGDASYRVLVMSVAAPGSGGETAVLVGGHVTSGALVVVEAFRLRRTFATILGADLSDAGDPLTLGPRLSGNSFVGDTLFLGDELKRDFLSLFNARSASAVQRASVMQFLDALAMRVMVLAHGGMPAAEWRRLGRVAEAASPAHVATSVLQATERLIVGVASLVGIDTFMTPKPQPGTVTIGTSQIGLRDLLRGDGRLDDRSDTPGAVLPVAVIDGPASVALGQGFMLSGLPSTAAPGRTIERYIWLSPGAGGP